MATTMPNTNINIPYSAFLDPTTGRPTQAWLLWLMSPNFITVNIGSALPVTSGGTGLNTIPTNGQLLIGNGAGYTLNTLGTGVGISVTNGTGTITVDNTGVLSNIAGAGISVSSATGNVTIANTGVLSFSGGTTGLTPATATTGAVTLAGTLAIASGGTNGSATPTAYGVAYGTGTAYAFTAAGTAKQVLIANTSSAPTWSTLTSGTSILYGDGSGGFSNVTIGSGISFAGGTLSATGSGGTVTSVTGTSPVVSSGGTTPAISLASAYGDTLNPYGTKTANYVLAGPTTGAAAVPAFRALVAADIPSLSYVTSVSGTTGRITSTGGTTPVLDLTSGIVTAGTTGSATLIPVITVDTYGRVTSITTAANPQGTVTSVTGTSPVVSSGGATPAISLATAYGDTLNPYASKTANYVLAAPNGSAGAPTFRALVAADVPGSALTKTDDTNVTLTLGGSPTTALLNAASLTLGWTGQLGISRGGTNTSTAPSAYGVVYGNSGGTAYTSLANGTTGQVLTATTSGAPSWAAPAYTGTVTSVSFTGGIISVATATTTPALTVAGTSGGIPYFSSGTAWASSAALTQYGVVYGGGAGAAPVSTAAGTTGQVLTATTSGAPTWAAPATSGTVTSVSVVSANGFAGTVATASSTPAITLTTSITGVLKGNGTAISAAVANTDYVPLSTVITKTADYTITGTDTWIINNKTGTALTLTFPAASSWTGRSITVKNMQALAVNSASSNIVPIDSTTAGTAILLGVVGNWATLVSDGTNWVIMQAASNNNLLLE